MRTLLIASAETMGPLRAQLQAATPPVNVVGELELDASDLDAVESVCAACRPDRAVVSLPAGRVADRLAVRARLRALGVLERVVTPIEEMLSADPASVRVGPGVQPADLGSLIGREPHPIDRGMVGDAIEGRTVLVTGAGGSIGSELVRIAAGFNPARIVLMERSENALFEIDRALAAHFPQLDRAAVLHDVVDEERTLELCTRYRPEVVLHAAAHKHVPLMEGHPAHAVNNNVFGTLSIARAAAAVEAERFVLISTDKAVNPTSVMGATKRLAERCVQGLAANHDASGGTRFGMVRFGNVLGSAGSVLTVWANQLAEGGPVTITDRRMTRFFMTIPEAASLVLQAGAMAGAASDEAPGREVFVLDMGEPVSIADMAERFVAAHGFVPAWDRTEPGLGPAMPIVVSGIRPGEKLHEELAYSAEQLSATPHPGIRRFVDPRVPDAVELGGMIERLRSVRNNTNPASVLREIAAWIPEWGNREVRATAECKPLGASAA